eukprot:754046-Hanusia_phi.AAC.1
MRGRKTKEEIGLREWLNKLSIRILLCVWRSTMGMVYSERFVVMGKEDFPDLACLQDCIPGLPPWNISPA